MRWCIRSLLAISLVCLAVAPSSARKPHKAKAEGTRLTVSAIPAPILEAASMDGTYDQPLFALHLPVDASSYGPSWDWGIWRGDSWRGHEALPES